MSYHGLGFEITSTLMDPTGAAITRTTTMTQATAWRYFMAVRGLLLQYRTGLARIRGRVVAADRVPVATALRGADAALTLANEIWRWETTTGTRAFRAFSTRSLGKLDDIARSGGIPNPATITLVERSRDSILINTARLLVINWARVKSWQASLGPTAEDLAREAAIRAMAEARARAAAEARAREAAATRAEEERRARAAAEERRKEDALRERVSDTVDQVEETIEDVIRDAGDALPPVPTLEQLVPGTTAPPPSRKWLWIGAGALGLGAVGYFILKD